MAFSPSITLQNIGKRYGRNWALKDVSITVGEGELVLIMGPNGAGKSTLIKLIAGVVNPTSGEVKLLKAGMKPSKPKARWHLGVLLHESFLYDELKVRENLDFFFSMYGNGRSRDWSKFVNVLGVDTLINQKVSELSSGWRKRVDIARTLIHHPRIVLFDEVFSKLDTDGCQLMTKSVIPQILEEGTTVVMTSHIFEHMDGLEYKTIELEAGRVISVDRKIAFEF